MKFLIKSFPFVSRRVSVVSRWYSTSQRYRKQGTACDNVIPGTLKTFTSVSLSNSTLTEWCSNAAGTETELKLIQNFNTWDDKNLRPSFDPGMNTDFNLTFPTGDKSRMLVGASGIFLQCERGIRVVSRFWRTFSRSQRRSLDFEDVEGVHDEVSEVLLVGGFSCPQRGLRRLKKVLQHHRWDYRGPWSC